MKRLVLLCGLVTLALAVSGCGGSRRTSGRTTRTRRTSVVFPPAVTPPIARVKASWPLFRSFPSRSGATEHCLLPGPGMSRGIKGWCSTMIDAHARPGEFVVTFREWWPWRAFRLSGSPHRTQHHSWRLVVRASGHVALLGQTGDFPPQSAE